MTWHTVVDATAKLLGGGQRYLRVAIAKDAAGRMQAAWPGAQATLEPEPAGAPAKNGGGAGTPLTRARAAKTTLQAPMAARVLAVQAREGSDVARGAALVVLEAMKMEHALTAPEGACVLAVHVQPGDQVTQGQRLVTLGPPLGEP